MCLCASLFRFACVLFFLLLSFFFFLLSRQRLSIYIFKCMKSTQIPCACSQNMLRHRKKKLKITEKRTTNSEQRIIRFETTPNPWIQSRQSLWCYIEEKKKTILTKPKPFQTSIFTHGSMMFKTAWNSNRLLVFFFAFAFFLLVIPRDSKSKLLKCTLIDFVHCAIAKILNTLLNSSFEAKIFNGFSYLLYEHPILHFQWFNEFWWRWSQMNQLASGLRRTHVVHMLLLLIKYFFGMHKLHLHRCRRCASIAQTTM